MAIFTIAALTTEINTDPQNLGLVALKNVGNDQGIADRLNALTGNGAANVFRNDVGAQEFLNCITSTDLEAMVQLTVSKLSMILQPGRLDATNANLRAWVQSKFSGTSLTAMQAVCQRTGSRAEVLWGTGTVITATQVGSAR